jgi:HEAT repeat protein
MRRISGASEQHARVLGGGVLVAAVLLCTLPAEGDLPDVPAEVVDALTQIDAAPSKATLNAMFPTPQAALDNLRRIALDPSNVGVQLRAIRALPAYCPAIPLPCGDTPVHDTLASLVGDYSRSRHEPQDVMRVRTAAEALGATRSGLSADVVTLEPLLDDPSRDVRATAVRALRNVCNGDAITPLSAHYQDEKTEQVKLEIYAALRDLLQCS